MQSLFSLGTSLAKVRGVGLAPAPRNASFGLIFLFGLVAPAVGCGDAASSPSSTIGTTRAAAVLDDPGSMMAGDSLRTGWYPDEPMLDPTTVGSPYFGQIFDTLIDGQVYAQPLVANGVLFVATESNWIYALDPATGSLEWSRRLATPWNAADLNCGDLTPTIGVTGTPAIDESTGTAYMVSKTYASGTSGPGAWYAHAIDLATGAERPGFPVEIAGKASNQPDEVFDPTYQMQRPGLLLMDGVVYAGFGAHCDEGTYYGWIVGISTNGAITTMWSTEAGPAHTKGGGIWQAGGGLVSDGDGQMLFATGNDWVAASTPIAGHTPPGNLGESVVRLSVADDGSLSATDFFSPGESTALNQGDVDLGSGAPMGLPSTFGTKTHPNLLVEIGKSGFIYLMDRDDLGGFKSAADGSDRVLQRLGPYGGVWGKPSVWPGDGGYLYDPVVNGCNDSTNMGGCLRAFKIAATADGTPTLASVAASKDGFGYGSSAVVVTSDGTKAGSALLWSTWLNTWDGMGAQLRAYDAVPSNGSLNLRFVTGIGQASKFTTPVVSNGRVYVGARDGHILGFGVSGAPPVRAEGVAFAPTLLGATSTSSVKLTASTAVNIMALGLSGDFSLDPSAPATPLSLAAGDTVTLPIDFHPSVEGPLGGALQTTTDKGTFSIPLSGVGLSATPKLAPSPALVTFASQIIGTTTSSSVTFTNVSTSAVVISNVMAPAAPFTATGLPAAGTSVAAGGSFTVAISFAPTTAGSSAGFLSVDASGAVAAVAIEGAGMIGGRLHLVPAVLDFGAVTVGESAKSSFTLYNDGDAPITIQKSKPPTSTAFEIDSPVAEGTVIAPGASINQPVIAAPVDRAASEDVWTLNADDGQGVRLFTMRVTGQAMPSPTPVTGAAATPSTVDDSSSTTIAPAEVGPLRTGCSVGGASSGSPVSFGLLGLAMGAMALRRGRKARTASGRGTPRRR
ncbi:MAG TPA: choice-of-anchor D domain-containing protein [Polyangia bacterium]|nr:choice-of-anchor D domain-containing protein [Polyangia bacterium]